jgi:uracil-DNA glycosylase
MNVAIEQSWKNELSQEFEQPYFEGIVNFLKVEKAAGKTIFPPGQKIFNAFDAAPFDKVKVVILGQDPYHGAGQAHGLSFSVEKGIKPPPSLVNIYKELYSDLGLPIPNHGYLQSWAEQGVLLLNATLTVEANTPNSHANIGWLNFTDAVIKNLSQKRENLVFLLWGKFAQGKSVLIDTNKHLIIASAHPSPFSAHSGFLGSKPFSKTNEWLSSKGITPIDWSLPTL